MCQLQRNKISLLELSSVPTFVGLSLDVNDMAVQEFKQVNTMLEPPERGSLSLLIKADFY